MQQASERGSATVWAALSAAVLCSVLGLLLGLGQVIAARHRAGGAADLAALAAADRALFGESDACATARRVATAQGAELVRCAVRGDVSDVRVRVRFGPYRSQVRSRAGPAAASPGAQELSQPA